MVFAVFATKFARQSRAWNIYFMYILHYFVLHTK